MRTRFSRDWSGDWYKRNKDLPETKIKLNNWRLKTRYGISSEDYETMAKEQDYKCAICKEEKKLQIDHCHSTKKVRGLLCFRCNVGLGSFNDSSDLLQNAMNYLK